MARMKIWSSEYYDREIEFSYSRLRAYLWGKIHKHDRWYMGKAMSYYNAEPVGRQEIQSLSHSKENFGCIHEPLLNISVTHVIDPWMNYIYC